MEKLIVFILSTLIFFSPVLARAGNDGGIKGDETFLFSDRATVRISFEHYKMQEGWTPVVLSIGEINCLLRMDETGKVLEMREPGAPSAEPVCFIDVVTKSLRKEADSLYFDVYEQNNIRTRWRLSSTKTVGTVCQKILFREKSGVDLYLGTLRLQLKQVAWDFKEFSPGLYHIQFHGSIMPGYQRLVYEKAVGKLHLTHEWDNKLILEQNRTQPPNPAASVAAAIPSQERAALIALYNSTNGDNWTNSSGWKTPPLAADGFALPGTENTWYGITCDPGNTTIQQISLYNNNLDGVLPPELGNLANLQYFRLSDNYLTRRIPPELGNLVNLRVLYLDCNNLFGTIPPELGNLINLRELYLDCNILFGSIPPQLGNLTNLQYLALGENFLSGSIPPELGNLANLHELCLSMNQLDAIPPELGSLANLRCLNLSSNNFNVIPPELGNLANLHELNLNSNLLNCSIPPELGKLANLQYLDLGSNPLSGSLPPELGNLTNLHELWLYWTKLSGSIPPELGNLANLYYLNLDSNQFNGEITPELGNLVNLINLELYDNQFSGSIPPELGNLADLQWLDLGSNQLSGSIPPELGNLANLYILELFDNQLNESIPPELGNLANLKVLALNSNRLSGSIPPNLTNLNNLSEHYGLNLCWNALYTNNDILRAFLDMHQWRWEYSQTVAPANITATSVSNTSIDIHWTPITYTSDTGGYRVFYSSTPGGPYTYFGMTADKLASSLTVTGLNPGVTYYFVVQTRTNPHIANLNTVDSEYSSEVSATALPLILTSPNGGESWGLNTKRNITWTSSGLSGNVRLELWKANKKLGNIVASFPIVNGSYAWSVGNYGPGIAPAGNDYTVKIITANGLYNDASNTAFSIIQPSLTLTSPRGSESWKLRTQQNITWASVGLTGNVKILLFKDGVQLGVIARGIPMANGTYAWTVGRYSGGMATAGSNYTVKIRSEDNSFYSSGSGPFTIW
ncbi:MAG: hypothetical protein QG657_3013 [Acidobacteriota bacterium]|nr:hypothetical protein [Acidobacteriota bacterium]